LSCEHCSVGRTMHYYM